MSCTPSQITVVVIMSRSTTITTSSSSSSHEMTSLHCSTTSHTPNECLLYDTMLESWSALKADKIAKLNLRL